MYLYTLYNVYTYTAQYIFFHTERETKSNLKNLISEMCRKIWNKFIYIFISGACQSMSSKGQKKYTMYNIHTFIHHSIYTIFYTFNSSACYCLHKDKKSYIVYILYNAYIHHSIYIFYTAKGTKSNSIKNLIC